MTCRGREGDSSFTKQLARSGVRTLQASARRRLFDNLLGCLLIGVRTQHRAREVFRVSASYTCREKENKPSLRKKKTAEKEEKEKYSTTLET